MNLALEEHGRARAPELIVYFDDPDGHSLEYIAILPGERPDMSGIVKLSEWRTLDAGAG